MNERTTWKERIEKAKEEYEKELEAKKQFSRETGNVDIFDPEDIEAMIYENENFNGKRIDFSQVQKYNQLASAANWLYVYCSDSVAVDCPPLPEGRAGYLGLDVRSLTMLQTEKVKSTLAAMIKLCDEFVMSSLDNDVIHLSFLVRDIRTK